MIGHKLITRKFGLAGAVRALLISLCVFVFLIGTVCVPGKLYANTTTFTGGELLGKPTDTSITINIVPDATIEYYYEYGTTQGGPYPSSTAPKTASGGQPDEVVITELSPNTRYYYRMIYDADGEVDVNYETRAEHTFHTQRAKGEEFVFTIISDSHAMYNTQYQQAVTNIIGDHPDFHFDLGDTFMTDGDTAQIQVNLEYLAQRNPLYMGGIGQSSPVFLASGNHENEEGWNLDDAFSIAQASIQARKLYYPTPVPDGFYSGNSDLLTAIDAGTYGDQFREDYYSWEWGDALFVVLDPFQYTMQIPYSPTAGETNDEGTPTNDRWTWTLGQQQFNWFKQTVENSSAKYKFVFAHHMVGGTQTYVRGGAVPAHMFEWGGNNADDTTWGFDTRRPGWGDDPIHQIMIDNHVSAFFHGHDHQYAYEVRDGIVYQSLPRPSTGLDFNYYSESNQYTERVLASPGHLRVTVTPDQTTVEYVTSSGTSGAVQHSYTILPSEASTDPTIAITGIPLTEFTSEPGTPSAEQSYTVSGSNLTDNITITAPTDFEISETSGSGFGSSLTLTQSDGSVAATTVYVRFNRAAEGTSSGNITHISSGAIQQNVAVSGTAAVAGSGVVALDGAVSSNTADDVSSIDVSHTTGTGTNRLMLVGVCWNSNTAEQEITSVTFTPSGDSPVYLDEVINQQGASQPRNAAIYSLLNPPSGVSGTVTVNFTGSVASGIVVGAANFAGVDQIMPLGTPGGDTASSSSAPTVTLGGLSGNELVFDTVFQGASGSTQTLSVGADQTEQWNQYIGNTRAAASVEQATGSSVTMSWTAASASVWVIAAVPINPAAAGPTHDLTMAVDPSGGGATEPAVGVHTYTEETVVDITATPGAGYVFDHWDGDCIGTGACQVTMDGDKSVTAYFAEAPPSPLGLDGAVSSNTAASGSSINVPHTTGTGTNRLMLVGVSANSYGTARTISSVTFTPSGGSATALTPVGSIENESGRLAAIYSLLDPPNGVAGTVTVTFSGSVGNGIVVGVANFAGVDQTDPLDDFVSAAGTQTSAINVDVPTDIDDLVFDTVFLGAATVPSLTVGSGQSQLWNAATGRVRGAASTEQAIGATTSMSWTASGGSTSYYWAIGAVPINPAPAGPTMPSHNILLGRPTDDSITVNAIFQQGGTVYFEYGTVPGSYTAGLTAILPVTANVPVEVVIEDLDPNTQYYYRPQFQATGWSSSVPGDEHSFHTRRAKDEPYTFTITSDSHLGQTFSGNNTVRYEQATLNVAADHPDFHIDLGDAFILSADLGVGSSSSTPPGNQSQVDAVYLAQRPYFGNFSHSAPVFLALGNHENQEGWNFNDLPFSRAIAGLTAQKEYFCNPIPDGFYSGNTDLLPSPPVIGDDQYREDYYAWTWGDALFIVLDPFQYTMQKPYGTVTGSGEDNPEDEAFGGDQWNWTLGQQQYNWFKQILQESTAKFKFVFSHHVVGGQIAGGGAAGPATYVRGGGMAADYFEWGGNNADDTWGFDAERFGWGDYPIHQLMVDYGVTAFFHGHDHQFVHEVVDGIVYQLVPSPGMNDYGFDLYDEDETDYLVSGGNLPSGGHLRVTVNPDENEATVEYVRSRIASDTTYPGIGNGEVWYAYTIAGAVASPLYGDIEPAPGGDCDVDGSDLAAWIAMGGIDLSLFAENFGQTTCP